MDYFGVLLVTISILQGGSSAYYGKLIGDLAQSPKIHLVEGKVYVVDATRLNIVGFKYDGLAPDAFFYVGTAGMTPSGNGMKIVDETGLDVKLKTYPKPGLNVLTLTLPKGVTWSSAFWISVWCIQFGVDFGHVKVPRDLKVPGPLKIGEFSRLAHGLRSGEVTILDSRRIKIENLFYDGQGPDAYFYIGNSSAPGPNGMKLKDEKQSATKLKTYTGQTIVLTLTDHTVFDFKWLSMWCIAATQNFGHVNMPTTINVPPYTQIEMNCEPMNDNFQVSWKINNSRITFMLRGKIGGSDKYMSFGISGTQTSSKMVNGDVTVAYYKNRPKAVDYKLTQYAQCSNGRGVCPDDALDNNSGDQNNEGISGSTEDGITTIQYTRMLDTGDSNGDYVIRTSVNTYIIWGYGRLNNDDLATKHDQRLIGDKTIKFGRTLANNCPALVPDTVAPTKAVPWVIPKLSGEQTQTFRAQIGQTGGDRGYTAITGTNSWGIAWYINNLLIPEIYVKRGDTFKFIVEGGNDTNNTARYHPFYITDDPTGGYIQLNATGKSRVKVFAGLKRDGSLAQGSVGRLCEWGVKSGIDATQEPSFEAFFKKLTLNCDAGSPGELEWTPDSNTPDLVYYQCYTHRYLGWKIHVVDEYPENLMSASTTRSSVASSTRQVWNPWRTSVQTNTGSTTPGTTSVPSSSPQAITSSPPAEHFTKDIQMPYVGNTTTEIASTTASGTSGTTEITTTTPIYGTDRRPPPSSAGSSASQHVATLITFFLLLLCNAGFKS